MGGLPYWGHALKQDTHEFQLHEANCGPVSSFHDRACEVAAQIKGTITDYGKAHSEQEKHAQFSHDYTGHALVEGWSEENPVILIGHSAGSHTCLRLQQLLAEDYWGWGSNANWVEGIVSISGVLNGSTLPYMLGCDKQTGLLTKPIGLFIGNAVQIFAMAGGKAIEKIYHFHLDHWLGEEKEGNFEEILLALEESHFAKNEDNLAFDLTLQGGYKANQQIETHPNTYYLSVITEKSNKALLTANCYPDLFINPMLTVSSAYQGLVVEFDAPPLPNWGKGELDIDKWRENDGAVSSISQRYPFTGGTHAIGGSGFLDRNPIQKGKWYYETVESMTRHRFDHLDVIFGGLGNLLMAPAHKKLYQQIYDLLHDLP